MGLSGHAQQIISVTADTDKPLAEAPHVSDIGIVLFFQMRAHNLIRDHSHNRGLIKHNRLN